MLICNTPVRKWSVMKECTQSVISVSHVQLYNATLCLQLLWQHLRQCRACSRWLGSQGRRWRCPLTSSQKQLFLELFPVSCRLWRVPPFAQPALSPPRLVAQHRWMPLPPKYKHRRHKRRFVCYLSYSWICSVIAGNMFNYDSGYKILWYEELMTWIETVLYRFMDCTYEARNRMIFKALIV